MNDTAPRSGKSADKPLWEAVDGLEFQAVYARRSDTAGLDTGRNGHSWQIVQRIDHRDPATANQIARHDVSHGAAGLALVVAGAPSAREFGLWMTSLQDFEVLLDGVDLGQIALRLEAGGVSLGAAACLIALAQARGDKLNALDISLGLDPLGAFGLRGKFPSNYPMTGKRLGDVATSLQRLEFSGHIVTPDSRPWHNAGASEAEEIAIVLASTVAYLRDMTSDGTPLDWAIDRIGPVLAAGADPLATIAKFRALRLVWAHLRKACGVSAAPVRLHGETSWAMMAAGEPHSNLIRIAAAVYAAGIGGASSVTALPFTSALGLPDELARRLARNAQLVLQDEAGLGMIDDPAAGAGALEAMTDKFAEQGWALFQEIEALGGMPEAISSEFIQKRVIATRAKRLARLAERHDTIIGATQFVDPQANTTPVEILDVPASDGKPPTDEPADLPPPGEGKQFDAMIELAQEGVSPAALTGAGRGKPLDLAPLPQQRFAEGFETPGIFAPARTGKAVP